MKSNLLKVLTVACFTAISVLNANNLQAQSKSISVGLGVDLALPTETNTITDFVLGGTLRGQYNFDPKVSATLTSGYYHYFNTNPIIDRGQIPVKGGIKYFAGDNLYFMGEIGAGFFTRSNGQTAFIYAPAIGYASTNIDLSLRYEASAIQGGTTGFVALRFAYGTLFKL